MSSQYMLSIIIDVMGAIVGNSGRVLDMAWDWRERKHILCRAIKDNGVIYVAKEKLKPETKTRLSKSIMCKRYAAFAMQNARSKSKHLKGQLVPRVGNVTLFHHGGPWLFNPRSAARSAAQDLVVQIVQCKTTASMSEVIIMFQDNWQSKSDRKNQMREE